MDAAAPEFLDEFDSSRRRIVKSMRDRTDSLDVALLSVKVLNLLLSKYEYRHRRINKIARPIGFMLDPANSCHLGCATCVNTLNKDYALKVFNPVPKGVMKPDTFSAFIDTTGMTSFAGHFYNSHEPLLNKRAPEYIKRAADYRVETFLSTNLSIPKLNVEALVASGIKEVMVAIDGVTQEVYSRYRRGGNVELVYENVTRIVEAKRKLRSKTPYLRWQFLTFEHNLHEVDSAISLAPKLGFDNFNLATPYDVSSDDHSVKAVTYDGKDKNKNINFKPYPTEGFTNDLSSLETEIFERLSESATERYAKLIDDDSEESIQKVGDDQCDWLHFAVISDAHGRIFPCCIGDFKNMGKFVYANASEDRANILNSDTYRAARRLIANPRAYQQSMSGLDAVETIRCDGCTSRPLPQVGLGAAGRYMKGSSGLFIHGQSGWPLRPRGSRDLSTLWDFSQHKSSMPA